MKINTKLLRESLTACAPVARLRTTLPILQCVRLEAVNNVLNIQATNCDVYVERVVECDGELPALAVNLRLLQSALEFDGAEEIELTAKGAKLSLSGSSRGNLATLEAATFPTWPDDETFALGVNCADLAEGLESVSWAVMEGDTRPTLANALVTLSPKLIECVGYDGHCMAHFARPCFAVEGEMNVPRDFTEPLIDALREEEAVLSMCERAALVKHKHGRTRIKLSDQLFPNGWRQVMEEHKKLTSLDLPVAELKTACSAAVVYGSIKMSPRLKIIQSDGVVRLFTSNENGDDYDKPLPIPDANGNAKTELNAQYLLKALQHIEGASVKWIPIPETHNSLWMAGDLTVCIAGLLSENKV